MLMENFETSIVITDDNREEMERLYGKIPPDNELLEVPETHSLEEAKMSRHPLEKSSDRLNDETEEVALDEISQQNISTYGLVRDLRLRLSQSWRLS